VDDTTPTSIAVPAITNALPTVGESPIHDHTAEEGFTLMQKGLFFAVILGCVVIYLRVSSRRGQQQERYREKSLA
jgi:hypothetical protein